MSIEAIAKDLVALCREGKHLEVIEKYYGDNIVSVEAAGNETMPKEMQGIEAIKGKNQWWIENNEVHSGDVSDPMIGESQFSVYFNFDVTFKPENQRMSMEEVGIYTVEDGKIVREQFFYNPQG